MRALLASPLGVLVGILLGALGGGGSILAVPVLVFVAGQTPAAATTTSLVVVGPAAAFGAFGHWRAGRVRVREGAAFAALGIVGSVLGSALNRRLDGDLLLLAFAGLLVVAAWRLLAAGGRPGLRERRAGGPAVVATGVAVGFMTGLFGVGGGFVIVPALALVLGFSMPMAVGTSLLVITVNSAAALAARGFDVAWATALPFLVAAFVGVGIGKRVADKVDARTLARWFAWTLLVVAGYTGLRAAVALV